VSELPEPGGNPRPTEDALQWQLDRMGSTAWEGWSLKFQQMAYGFADETGIADSRQTLRWLAARGGLGNGQPPRGKLVWYTGGDCGRASVMSSLGDGKVVGAGVDAAVGVMDYRDRDGYVGWSEPVFPYA